MGVTLEDLHDLEFDWPHTSPTDVIVTGTFDQWSSSVHLTKNDTGFSGTVRVPWGEKVSYKFIVDGCWLCRDDRPQEGEGNINNFLQVPVKPDPPVVTDLHDLEFDWPQTSPTDVIVTGTFDQWSSSIRLAKGDTGFYGTVKVPWDEKVSYKFIVDGCWLCRDDQPQEDDGDGNINNFLQVPVKPEPPVVHAADLHFDWPHTCPTDVIVTGTFDQWSSSIRLVKGDAGFFGIVKVPWGEKVSYKFIVDGYWLCRDDRPQEDDGDGNINNFLQVPVKRTCCPLRRLRI
ncbi:carbohydrate-binding module family 48 protein [Paxillus involutus ATCC 200175]|uniref:Carbohydrate-binding module family 48 protein n=1 Tax=Paxillus involutus ATCC 200175 TaxID=664439 RepID=A0A0C9TDM8_PAXIN|nr:carbohydrate-binding module family 48 protein [Paxillus involutus ATCC 200175]